MSADATETEIKYDVPAGADLPALDDLPEVARTLGPALEQLEAEYYDTDDLRLIRAGVTLRRRRGGDDAGWHLKLPTGPDSRREVRLPIELPAQRIPDELAALVQVHTRGRPLRPVAQLTTTRQRLTLLGGGGESLAEVVADDVRAQTLGAQTSVSSWHEVEVELTGGDRALLDAADELLRRDGLRPAGRSAKLERALGGRLGKPAAPPPLSAASPAGEVVLAYLAAHAGRLKSLDPLVRRDEPDAVHQMRVATRRLRSTLRSFEQILHPDGTGRLGGELKWLGTMLGAVRDAEVLLAHLQKAIDDEPLELVLGPVQARVQGHYASAQADARREMLAALDSARYFSLLDDLDALLTAPPLTPLADRPADEVLPAAARRPSSQVRHRMRRARRAQPGTARDAALHEARKAAKRARYAGEAISPALGKPASKFAARMKKVQSVLGDHQNTVIARQAERELGIGAHRAGENAFSYGLLYGRDACEGQRLQARARRAWKRAHKKLTW